MTAPRPGHAVVTLPALDVRRRPDHASELLSQLLMGEVVRALDTADRGRWWRIRNAADGYAGWVRTWGLVPCPADRARRWLLRARARVAVSHAEIRSAAGDDSVVSPVFWNSRLIVGPARGGRRTAELPDGRRGVLDAAVVRVRPGPALALMDRVRALFGIPYLWGGRTPMGFDCSALTQQLWFEQGLQLPRDARDQWRACRPIPVREARIGDLVFFAAPRRPPGHVGLVLGGGYYVHARGRVLVGSIDSSNPLCDKELLFQLQGCGAPPGRPRSGLPKASRTPDSA